MKLWSARYSNARGEEWMLERKFSCIDDAKRWKEIDEKDNPGILFHLSLRKPRIRPVCARPKVIR